MKQQQSGFTLIELVAVIAVLGILAATAIPKFVDMSTESRIAVVNGVAGAMRSAVAICQARYFSGGNGIPTEVVLQGQSIGAGTTVGVGTGIPVGTANGIGRALSGLSGFTVDYTTATAVTFTPTGSSNCNATYNGTTGVVSINTAGC